MNRRVERDLETICLKCLQKDPSRRYGSAEALAEDLERFRRDEPVFARPVSRGEHFWRACRRNPMLATLGAATTLLLLGIAIGSPIAALRINGARQQAELHLYNADMALAQRVRAEHDLRRARSLLDVHRPKHGQPDFRSFEWRHLWRLCQGDEVFALEPELSGPRRVFFSPDGRWLAAGREEWGRVWDLTSPRRSVIATLGPGNCPLAFVPGRPLLVSGGSGGLKLWNTVTWQAKTLAPAHSESVAAFSNDGRWMIVHGHDLQLWDATSWTLVRSNIVDPIIWQTKCLLALSPRGDLVVCGSGLPYIFTTRMEAFRIPSFERVPFGETISPDTYCLTFTPDGRQLITGGSTGAIRIWDVATEKEIPSMMKHQSWIHMMSFSPADSNLLATTGSDHALHLWDFATQTEKSVLHGALDNLEELAFAPDGSRVAVGGNPILIFESRAKKSDDRFLPQEAMTWPLGFESDSQHFITIDARGDVARWHMETLSAAPLIHVDMDGSWVGKGDLWVAPIETSPDLRWLALGRTNGEVQLWDLLNKTNHTQAAHSQRVRAVAFSADGRILASAGEEKQVRVWDTATGRRLAEWPIPSLPPDNSWPVRLAFSPDGKWLAVGANESLEVWEIRNGRKRVSFDKLPLFATLRFSPDGRTLVTTHHFHQFYIWDTSTWSKQALPGHDEAIAATTFSPDGRRLITGSDKVALWDTATWQELVSFRTSPDTYQMIFSPDGNVLVAGDLRAGLRVWRAPPFNEIAAVEQAGRWTR